MSPDSLDWRSDGPGGLSAPAHVPGFPDSASSGQGHAVRFYGNETSLASAVADFIAPALASGQAALVFASPQLRQALLEMLPQRGIEAEPAMRDGRLHLHDACEVLDRILSPAGLPDEDKFMRVIGGLIAKASANRPALRAFAGMSALPWAAKRPEAALELERLWGLLGKTVAFSLLCAYPLRGLPPGGLPEGEPRAEGESGPDDAFSRICDAHDWVIPCEPYHNETSEAGRLRQIAALQLRLAKLETERGNGWTIGDPQRGLTDDFPVLLWSTAPDGKLNFVNRTWVEFTGSDGKDEPGAGLNGVHPEDRAMVEAAYGRALEGRDAFHTEFRFRRRDGAWRWLLNSASPRLDAEGAFLGFAGACIDITDRKAAAGRAREAQNLESLGRLAGGLAHDFNNLLTAINGYSEISLGLAPAEGPLRDFLAEIRNAGERANELTRQLLAYGRKQILSPTLFDLNGTLDDLEPALNRLLGEGIRLERVQQPGLGRIQADPGQIQQLILTLAINAREAMPGGGTLLLATEDVLVPSDQSEQPDRNGGPRPFVRLSVSDSGPGLDREAMARIFEPFFTIKPSVSPERGKAAGGIGLPSAYGIARQTGGYLTVENASGPGPQGSVFRLYLPWHEPEPGKYALPGPGGNAAGAILVATESEPLRRFLSRSLAAEGYAISEAADGQGADSLGDAAPIDLLIAGDPCAGVRVSALAARLKLRHAGLRTLSLPMGAEVSDLPLPPRGNAALPLPLPLTRTELIAAVGRALGGSDPEEGPGPPAG